jgi:hypothetical protein
MSPLRQRIEPIRSAAIRDSARGAPCMLEFPCCNHDPETSVWCHWEDESFGMGRKAHDTSGFAGCSECHRFLDVGWAGKMSVALVRGYVIRAMQRAFVHLIEVKAVTVKLDAPKPAHERAVMPRAPREKRAKVGKSRPLTSRKTEWPSRPLRTRPAIGGR